MHDIRAIRDNPAAFDAALAKRGDAPLSADLLAMDEARRTQIGAAEAAQAEANKAAKEVGAAKGRGDDAEFERLRALVSEKKAEIAAMNENAKAQDAALSARLAEIPNLPADDVPMGADEDDNVEVSKWGTPRDIKDAVEHYEIAAVKPGMDFETAAKISGSRFVPTSEVPLTYSVAGDVLDEAALPIRYTAHSLCFRSEAGSAGRDTSGMLRQHQFEKVEMVSVTHPDQSDDEQKRMLRCAEDLLERLDIPYRTVLLCTGDMGFGARRTFDIEAWLPGQNAYREISSVSTTGAFQARRMNARFKPTDGGKPQFVHTLNGSGLAVGRCLIAVLENGQQPDESVTIPAVLHGYMGGKTTIQPDGTLA